MNKQRIRGTISRHALLCVGALLVLVSCGDSKVVERPALQVSIVATPGYGVIPLTVEFGTTLSGGGLTFEWDLDGDGTADSAEPAPSFTYASSGTYPARLTVTDTDGDTANATVYIHAFPPTPVVTAGADVVLGAPPLEVSFTAEATGEAPFTYSWDLTGDGDEDSAEQNPTFTFTESGVYSAVVSAVDAAGTTAEDLIQIVVNTPPIAEARGPECVRTNTEVLVEGLDSYDPDSVLTYEWSFVSSPTGSAEHFTGPVTDEVRASFSADVDGVFVLQLSVSDGHSTDTAEVTVTVADNVTLTAVDGDTRTGRSLTDIDPPLEVTVTNVCSEDPLVASPIFDAAVEWTGGGATPADYESVTNQDGFAVYDGGEFGDPGDATVTASCLGETVEFDLAVTCEANTDCENTTGGACDTGGCSEASCDDGLLNQDETSVDCGGHACGASCEPGEGCVADYDCASFICDGTGECGSICGGGGWTEPGALDRNAVADNASGSWWLQDFRPAVASAGSTWLTVWSGNTGPDFDILFTRSGDNRKTWSPTTTVAEDGNSRAYVDFNPDVAGDGAGGWVVVWETTADKVGAVSIGYDNDLLVASSSDDGETWSNRTILNSSASTDSSEAGTVLDRVPDVATDGTGNWVAAWMAGWNGASSRYLPAYHILYAYSVDGGSSWSTQSTIDSGATLVDGTPDLEPTVAADGSGLWAAAWWQYEWKDSTSRMYRHAHVFAATSDDPSSGWETPVQLNTTDDTMYHWNFEPDIAADGARGWLAAWSSNTTQGNFWVYDVMVATGSSDGSAITWNGGASIATFDIDRYNYNNNSFTPRPAIATDSRGTWVVAWLTATKINYAYSDDAGETWSEMTVLDDRMDDETVFDLAGSKSGDWMLAWDTDDMTFGFVSNPDTTYNIGTDSDIIASFLCNNLFLGD